MQLAFIVFMTVPATQCLRQDEVECEEAVAYLIECCPGFDHGVVRCEYQTTCGVTYPDLTTRESQCILDASCEELRQHDLCNRVVARSAANYDPETPSGLEPELCQ
jgi:hypothetical protein